MRFTATVGAIAVAGLTLTGCSAGGAVSCDQGLGAPSGVTDAFFTALETGDASALETTLAEGPYGTSTDLVTLAEQLGPTTDYGISMADSEVAGTYLVTISDTAGTTPETFEIYELEEGADNPLTYSACYDAAWGDATVDPSATPSVAAD
ncbi:hypothetical protein [Demequina salsinemoris]|uniref:hypothetical protein n=1 Tax=Demequina salsinemoris TaxID=577470 RepID=UPI00078315F2|nr:hypothetical protein [Demequina salsinemoris]